MEHIFITNNINIATICEKVGVKWVMVDLEIRGKEIRQAGRNSVISRHTLEDITVIRRELASTKLLVRCNPWWEGSTKEIKEIIERGADAIMLPMVESLDQVINFARVIDKKVKVFILVETIFSYDALDQICKIDGVDAIHIGLNDLSLQLKNSFMFKVLADGYIDQASEICQKNKIKYGFGGIAQLGEGLLPAEKILAEHIRLNSQMVILSRSFLNSKPLDILSVIEAEFSTEFKKLKNYEVFLRSLPSEYFELNKKMVKMIIHHISQQ